MRHKDGKWIMIYLAQKSSFSFDPGQMKVKKKIKAYWVDPVTGNSTPEGSFKPDGEKTFVTPDTMEDSILILQAE